MISIVPLKAWNIGLGLGVGFIGHTPASAQGVLLGVGVGLIGHTPASAQGVRLGVGVGFFGNNPEYLLGSKQGVPGSCCLGDRPLVPYYYKFLKRLFFFYSKAWTYQQQPDNNNNKKRLRLPDKVITDGCDGIVKYLPPRRLTVGVQAMDVILNSKLTNKNKLIDY
jgi:hypothetical protein